MRLSIPAKEYCVNCKVYSPKSVSYTHLITEMILQDIGLGFVPRRTIEAYPPDRRPRYYRILDDISSQTFVLAYREGALSRAAQAFYSIMTEND